MIRHMRHGSPPRLLAFQSILSPNRRESLPTPSAGGRITQAPHVGRDDGVRLRQPRYDVPPFIRGLRDTVDEDHRIPLPSRQVIERHLAEVSELTLDCNYHGCALSKKCD